MLVGYIVLYQLGVSDKRTLRPSPMPNYNRCRCTGNVLLRDVQDVMKHKNLLFVALIYLLAHENAL